VRALSSHFVIIHKDAIPKAGQPTDNNKRMNGLYCAEIEFNSPFPENKLSEYIKHLPSEKIKKIDEFTSDQSLTLWDVKGNDHILSVSYILEKDVGNYVYTLKALTKSSKDFVLCEKIEDGPQVLSIEIIIPFEDSEKAYALYGTTKGLDGSGH